MATTKLLVFLLFLQLKNKKPNEILSNINLRMKNGRRQEFKTACNEVEKIARLRIHDLFEEL